jgi:hypothetical protein
MRSAGLSLLAFVSLTSAGCFHMTTTLTVRGDGSGTIEHKMLVTNAGIAQLKNFGALAGRGQNVDPVSEEQARTLAASIGPGVTYVSSTPTSTPIGQGRDAIYAFTDVSQLRISPRPAVPAGLPTSGAPGLSADATPITFSLTHEANGNAILHIHVPEPDFLGTLASPNAVNQIAMVRMLLGGARVSLMAEPAGTLVKSTSPYVEGSRVTLLGIDLDEILKDEASITRLQTAKTQEEAQAVLEHLAGLKIDLTREITIEFTPAK